MASPRPQPGGEERAFLELHCHTSASFDSLADPVAVARAAAERGLTHLAITDHDSIEGAIRAREADIPELVVIVGEEINTADGDLIALFLDRLVPPGLSAVETIAAVREQGGLVGVPHPFDRIRGFGRKSGASLESIVGSVDWIEAWNARVVSLPLIGGLLGWGSANQEAADFARAHNLPGAAASDSHTVMEVGVTYNIVHGDPGTPQGLLASLAGLDFVPGRASYVVRTWTPIAKIVQQLRGNGRRRGPASTGVAR